MRPSKHLKGILAGFALSALATGTLAQDIKGTDLIAGGDVDTVLAIARNFGSAIVESQRNGDPKLTGQIDQIRYSLYFLNCTDHRDCRQINFYAGFAGATPALDVINTWNREKRFGRAYIDSVGDPAVEMDVNMSHGVSRDNLEATFSIWRLVMGEFLRYLSPSSE